MSLLLDTHIVLWWLADDPTLSQDIKARLDHDPDVYVSPGDPFDRMLVAQAQCEDLTLVTRDAHISRYKVAILMA